nr:MAG TPA: YebO-like protein [Caudoviricetes sp.]DAP88342.1 MAG TPA: YebO-like protein [Caudoviricetes sp.]DAQ42885.1 MAG TPA: YebO-like protein [Caudoviricetes sp.]DAS26640.1 MAG TPA: YebO-like protein [Caudoviricetes sp.]DAU92891.1 MAG TPA: YebO-like protein [Caudoviricetes sp.]
MSWILVIFLVLLGIVIGVLGFVIWFGINFRILK